MFGRVRDGVPEAVSAVVDFVERVVGAETGYGAGLMSEKASLSSRELQVLRLLAAGRSNSQIAEALVISPSTVAKHVSSILTRTESANRVEAATYAHRHGLV